MTGWPTYISYLASLVFGFLTISNLLFLLRDDELSECSVSEVQNLNIELKVGVGFSFCFPIEARLYLNIYALL